VQSPKGKKKIRALVHRLTKQKVAQALTVHKKKGTKSAMSADYKYVKTPEGKAEVKQIAKTVFDKLRKSKQSKKKSALTADDKYVKTPEGKAEVKQMAKKAH